MNTQKVVYATAGVATLLLVSVAVLRTRQRRAIEAAHAAQLEQPPSLVSDEAEMQRLWAEQQRQQADSGPVVAQAGADSGQTYRTRYRFTTYLGRVVVERRIFAPGETIPGEAGAEFLRTPASWKTQRQLCEVASSSSDVAQMNAAREYLSATGYTPSGQIAQRDATNRKWRNRCGV